MSQMPFDVNGNPLPLLAPKLSGGAHTISVATASAKNSTPFDGATRAIRVMTTVDAYFRQGEDDKITATTSDHKLRAGDMIEIPLGGDHGRKHRPYIAFVRASADGTVNISELE